jgi:hypothetical protein
MILKNITYIISFFLFLLNTIYANPNSYYNRNKNINFLQREYSAYNILKTLDCNETLPIINDFFYSNERSVFNKNYFYNKFVICVKKNHKLNPPSCNDKFCVKIIDIYNNEYNLPIGIHHLHSLGIIPKNFYFDNTIGVELSISKQTKFSMDNKNLLLQNWNTSSCYDINNCNIIINKTVDIIYPKTDYIMNRVPDIITIYYHNISQDYANYQGKKIFMNLIHDSYFLQNKKNYNLKFITKIGLLTNTHIYNSLFELGVMGDKSYDIIFNKSNFSICNDNDNCILVEKNYLLVPVLNFFKDIIILRYHTTIKILNSISKNKYHLSTSIKYNYSNLYYCDYVLISFIVATLLSIISTIYLFNNKKNL